MIEKKNHKADLDRHRWRRLLLSLCVATIAFFVALFIPLNAGFDFDGDDTLLDDVAQDMKSLSLERHEDMIALIEKKEKEEPKKVVATPDAENEAVEVEQTTDNTGDITETDEREEEKEKTDPISPIAIDDNEKVLGMHIVEQLPEYPGGMVEFMKWLTRTLKYPAQAKLQRREGTVKVTFIVNKDGSIADAKLVKKVAPALDKEAMRVISLMPAWKPGKQEGKPCRTLVCIPIVFAL